MSEIVNHEQSERLKGNPRFLEGEGSLKLKSEPLPVKEQPTIGLDENWRNSQRFENSIFRKKGSWLFDKQAITKAQEGDLRV
jgi:hypothetical protein